MILKFYCRSCCRDTNHGIVSFEHQLPHFNFSTIQCLACDTGSFPVKYAKDQQAPLYNSARVHDSLLKEEGDTERGREIHSSPGWIPPFWI